MSEKSYRSLVKGITWRAVALCDTILLSFIFTGHLGQALAIGLGELVTKIFLYYLHERGWLHFASWHDQRQTVVRSLRERHIYSIAKTATWRIIGSLDTVIWALFITGSVGASLSIGAAEVLTKVVLFYVHERAWLKAKWGLKMEENKVAPLLAQRVLD